MSESECELEQTTELSMTNDNNIVDQQEFTTELQKYYKGHNKNSKKSEWTSEKIVSVIKLIDDYNIAKTQGKRPTNQQYHHANKYDVMNIGDEKVLIMKRKSESDPVKQIIPSNEYYKIIRDTHIATSHGRRDKIVHTLKLNNNYVVPKFAISIFLNLCKTCISKKSFPKSGIVEKPLSVIDFIRRGQVDLINFQSSPDNGYQWLMKYQDIRTKFSLLRPLRSNQAKEVAIEVLKIFLEIGCPYILQSDNGREFTSSVLKEIINLWPACKIINARSKYSQSQGSINHSNQDVQNMIRAWMAENNSTNWSLGCYFVQFQKNSSHHPIIAKTPYKALFGGNPKIGFSSTHLSENITSKLETEEDFQKIFEQMSKNGEKNREKNIIQTERNKQGRISEPGSEIIAQHQTISSKNSVIIPNTHKKIVTIEGLNILNCHICDKETFGTHVCLKCKNAVHAKCGVWKEDEDLQLTCNFCVKDANIVQGRKESQIKKRATDVMTIIPSKKFKNNDIPENFECTNSRDNSPDSQASYTSEAEHEFVQPIIEKKVKVNDINRKEDVTSEDRYIKEEYDVFSQLIAIKLRKLKPHNRLLAERRINNIFYDLELAELDATTSNPLAISIPSAAPIKLSPASAYSGYSSNDD